MTRIFYSHAKKLYGRPEEASQLSTIKNNFALDATVVDPGAGDGVPDEENKEIEYFLRVIDQCDCLVFSRYRGVVTSGVLREVNYALSKGKAVYELRSGGRIIPIKKGFARSSKIDALRFVLSESLRDALRGK